ncbi:MULTISPECIES: AMP-binding protein [unclassified Nocardioides]|uniref:AMP-binding protein n=1 Tax=unclassified Nocardioides TaxID=2615069 RepID=UPI0006FE5350|nr:MULTISPECIES: AMP-binding protein [unclassified Nocardioides]KQY57612.1 cyclohexanecarboxylate--CoA ligase [Nocardioides sp. Root140]KQZ76019.1 cyclohexanecarboxylate--CoA ligase [Nocardioides sp. Root151]KRF15092.1 cyclohexanecarboxylate--CoA ligase [Nocardioides sp. Soil796]
MSFETILTSEMVADHTGKGYWLDRTITDYLDDWAGRTPDKVAFVDPRRSVTYAGLKDEVDRAALRLLDLGVQPGDVVSFQLPNWIEWVVVHYAATRIGAISNPLIPIYRQREVGFMVGLAESKVIVVPQEFRGFDYPAMVEELRGGWPALEHVLVVDGDGEDSWNSFLHRRTDREATELATMRPDPNDVTLLIFTSGTTGEPKGVMHTHNTVVAANDALPERLGITSDTVFHMASTLAHLTGFLYGARLNVQNGATAVLQDVWDAHRFVELVAEHGISYTSAATPFLHDTLQADNLADHDLSSLTRFCCMGAPIPRAIVREAKEQLPDMVVLGGWGQSENGLVTLGIPGDPEDKIIERDGFPWPGMEIRTVDPEGRTVPAGEEGRLQVRGPFLFVGYAKRLEMTRDLFEDGWFDTGDLARIDEEGYVSLSGRTKDVIIRGGENIPVSYIENVLYESPKLEMVALVAVPDPRLQERACACVILKDGVDDFTFEEMQQFLAGKGVAKQYWPEYLRVLADFPKTPSGKIQKFQLRDQVKV